MRRARLATWLLLLAALAGARWWQIRPAPTSATSASFSPSPSASYPSPAFAPATPPAQLPSRAGTAAQPVLAWERLLAADGSPAEDLAALGDLVNGYVHSGLGDARRSIGFNEDLVSTLTDRTALDTAALPPDHPAIRDGRLLDRWGTPWQVHPLSADVIQLRSAGPDRRLYTPDDLVAPPPP